nr:hypothetical protein [Tanacetum cinerariifolium]
MYGLYLAPRAWYGTLSKYLLTNGFQRGIIDQTLFIRRHRGDFIHVQVYVDDIIFGSSNPQLCIEFEALMHEKFQISAMGELNFFLGLQVLQKKDGIFLSQDKYVGDILKKFGYSDVRSANTPMDKENPWGKDRTSKDVDLHLYRSMIGSLMYLTASRPDIMFAICACARHQVTHKECHLHAVKRIFRYLKTIMATSTTEIEYVAAASGCGQVLWIQNQLLDYGHHFIRYCYEKKLISVDHIHTDDNVADLLTKPFDAGRFQSHTDLVWIWLGEDYGNLFLMGYTGIQCPNTSFYLLSNPNNTVIMARLAFCDYHNMITILEKYEHNVDFHQIVDFVEASHIRYALIINPTVYVSHIRQFWSTARIKTTDEGTKILATLDGKLKIISESSIRRNLKLHDEEGISALADAKLFENLALMGYNIFPNQKFTFQKGQFSHQWKYLIHTIMQCLSPKSTCFNEFSSNIATAVGEGSRTPTEPHHIPSPEAQQSPHNAPSSPSLPPTTTETIPTSTPTRIPTLRQYSRRARIAQSSALPTAADEPASPLGDDSQGKACPTVSGLEAGQDRANIIQTSALPHDLTPRVTSLAVDEGSMQQQLNELTDLCTCLQRQQSEMATKFADQELEIACLKARIKLLEDKDGGGAEGEEFGDKGGSSCKFSPVTEIPTVDIPTGSGLVPTASPIFTTASVVIPYSRHKAREMEEQMARQDQRRSEQIARDAEIARIHAKEELQMLIDGLDRNNEVIARHLHEYEQATAELTIGEKIELINELIEDFVPMASKEEGERIKRKGLRLEQESPKKMKTSEEVSQEDLKEMMQLVPMEEVYVEALQVKHPIIDWKIHSEGQRNYWKIIKLGGSTAVELKRLFEPDVEDQLWTHTQALMHDPVDWRLYDTCGVHHVLTKDQEIFMLVEKDYPLRKGLAIVMISNKL